MSNLPNIVQKMIGDDSSLQKATKRSIKGLATLGKTAGKLTAGAGLLGGALAGAAVAGATVLAAKSAESIDSTRKLAVNLGVTSDQAAALKRTFENTGVGADNGIKAFQRLQRSLGDSQLASKASGKALAELGITSEQLKGKLPFERFQIVTDAMAKMTDAGKRAQVGNQLLGRQWQVFGTLLKDNGATLRESIDLFERLGLGLGDSGGEVETMNDAMADLFLIGASLRDKVFAAMAPKLAELAVAAKAFVVQLLEATGGADGLVKLITGQLASGLQKLFSFFGGVAQVVGFVVDAFDTLGDVMQWVGEVLGGIFAAVGALLEGNFSEALTTVRNMGDIQFGDSDEDREQSAELKKQTEMLSRIAKNTFGAVLS